MMSCQMLYKRFIQEIYLEMIDNLLTVIYEYRIPAISYRQIHSLGVNVMHFIGNRDTK